MSIITAENMELELLPDEVERLSREHIQAKIESLLMHGIQEINPDLSREAAEVLAQTMKSSVIAKYETAADRLMREFADEALKTYESDLEMRPCTLHIEFIDYDGEVPDDRHFQTRKEAFAAIDEFVMSVYNKNPNHTYTFRKVNPKKEYEIREKGEAIIKMYIRED
jgi:hypothetical protein